MSPDVRLQEEVRGAERHNKVVASVQIHVLTQLIFKKKPNN